MHLKYSNLCEKHTSTSQTDRQTDDLLWHNRAKQTNRQNKIMTMLKMYNTIVE